MSMRHGLIAALGSVLLAILCTIAGLTGTARAQTPAPTSAQGLPWGLPPLPPGVGPIDTASVVVPSLVL